MDDIVEEYFELSDSEDIEDINNIKLPYVIKNKILMSPGVWNSYYYGADEIKDAFHRTDWNSKENRSLFLDHMSDKSSEWIGEVINPKLSGDDIVGDLVIVDRDTATKLAYKAKMGISPKVHGGSEGNAMRYFTFDNFSVVINPAVKTAWINNSEYLDLEKLNEFIDVYKSFIEAEDIMVKMSDYTDFLKKYIQDNKDLPIAEAMKKAAQEWKKQKEGNKMVDEVIPTPQELEEIAKKKKEEEEMAKKKIEVYPEEKMSEFSSIKTMLEQVMSDIKELKEKYKYPEKPKEEMAKKEEYPYPYKEKKMEEEKGIEVVKEMSSEIEKLKEQVNVLTVKLNEPNKISVKQELSEDADTQLFNILKSI